MKKTLVRIVVVTLLLLAAGATPVLGDSTPGPMCYPGSPCSPK